MGEEGPLESQTLRGSAAVEEQEVCEWTDMHTCKEFISQYTSSFHGVT